MTKARLEIQRDLQWDQSALNRCKRSLDVENVIYAIFLLARLKYILERRFKAVWNDFHSIWVVLDEMMVTRLCIPRFVN